MPCWRKWCGGVRRVRIRYTTRCGSSSLRNSKTCCTAEKMSPAGHNIPQHMPRVVTHIGDNLKQHLLRNRLTPRSTTTACTCDDRCVNAPSHIHNDCATVCTQRYEHLLTQMTTHGRTVTQHHTYHKKATSATHTITHDTSHATTLVNNCDRTRNTTLVLTHVRICVNKRVGAFMVNWDGWSTTTTMNQAGCCTLAVMGPMMDVRKANSRDNDQH